MLRHIGKANFQGAIMNNAQRTAISELIGKLNELKEQAGTIGALIQDIADEEQDKFDNLSEGLQQTENGQNTEEAAQALRNAADAAEEGDINTAIDELEGIQ